VPKIYTQKDKQNIINEICRRMIENGEALRNIIKSKALPDLTTFYVWIDANKEFSNQYARAIELRSESMANDIMNISDATKNDVIKDENGNKIVNHNVIQRDRLRVDSRKWLMSKMYPKKYGDYIRQDNNVTSDMNLSELKIHIVKPDNDNSEEENND